LRESSQPSSSFMVVEREREEEEKERMYGE